MARSALRRMFPQGDDRVLVLVGWACLALGLLIFVTGIGHTVAVIGTAIHRGAGYDTRLALMLVVGLSLVVPGGILIGSSRSLARGSRAGHVAATGAAAFLALELGILASALGTPAGVLLYGGLLAALLTALRRAA